jgi:hypothetical protein
MDGRTKITWGRISSSSELGLKHGDCGWKDQEEHNGIVTLKSGF